MDKSMTIKDMLALTDKIYSETDNYAIFLSCDHLEQRVLSLQSMIKDIQAVARHMADVSNEINQILLFKKRHMQPVRKPILQLTKLEENTGGYLVADLLTNKHIDPYPKESDHTVVRFKYAEETREISPGVSIPIKTVETPSKIPISHMYYIKSLNCYAININGVIIKGDLCDILPYGSSKTAMCSYDLTCKKRSTCQFYHSDEKTKRAFTPGSWIYNNVAARERPSKYYTRHVGDGKSLLIDLKLMSKSHYNNEVLTRECQVIHDLLIYIAMTSHGLVDDYKPW